MLRQILLITTMCAALNVFGWDNKGRKSSKHWSSWSVDTASYKDGMEIIKKRQRYLRNQHSWSHQTIIFKYDLCNHLIQKSKEYSEAKCFSGNSKMIYDRHYKRNCSK